MSEHPLDVLRGQEHPLALIWDAFVDRGWDGTKAECYACGRDVYGTHGDGCVIGHAIPALRAVEQLEQAARNLDGYANDESGPYVLVRLDELRALTAALALFDRKKQT